MKAAKKTPSPAPAPKPAKPAKPPAPKPAKPPKSPKPKQLKPPPPRVPLTDVEVTVLLDSLSTTWDELAAKHPPQPPKAELLATILSTTLYRSEAGHACFEIVLQLDTEPEPRRLVHVLKPASLCFAFHTLRRLGVQAITDLASDDLKDTRVRVTLQKGKNKREAVSVVGLASECPTPIAA